MNRTVVRGSWMGAAFALLALTLGRTAAQPPLDIDVTRLGPQVGTRIPAFSLPDQNGTVRTLASLAGPKGTMLVFFRSADW